MHCLGPREGRHALVPARPDPLGHRARRDLRAARRASSPTCTAGRAPARCRLRAPRASGSHPSAPAGRARTGAWSQELSDGAVIVELHLRRAPAAWRARCSRRPATPWCWSPRTPARRCSRPPRRWRAPSSASGRGTGVTASGCGRALRRARPRFFLSSVSLCALQRSRRASCTPCRRPHARRGPRPRCRRGAQAALLVLAGEHPRLLAVHHARRRAAEAAPRRRTSRRTGCAVDLVVVTTWAVYWPGGGSTSTASSLVSPNEADCVTTSPVESVT